MTSTRDRLRRLPELAAEAWLTWDAPNPSERAERKGRRDPAESAPTDVATLDALRPDGRGLLARITECVRIAWEDLDPEDRPALTNPPTWASECDWLLTVWDSWLAIAELADVDWIESEVRQVSAELEQVTRQPQPLPLRCTEYGCGDVLRVQDGGLVARCDSGHEHPGPMRLAAIWRRKPPVPAAIIEMELGVSASALRKWKQRRKITPAYSEGRVDYWLPWDVLRVTYPELDTPDEPRAG